jgi:hypothetical protein
MRLYRLLTLAAPIAMLLPLSAQAAWPSGARDQYMNECIATATQSVDKATAQTHCTCGANVIEKKFSTAETKELNSQTAEGGALRARLLKEIDASCTAKK